MFRGKSSKGEHIFGDTECGGYKRVLYGDRINSYIVLISDKELVDEDAWRDKECSV